MVILFATWLLHFVPGSAVLGGLDPLYSGELVQVPTLQRSAPGVVLPGAGLQDCRPRFAYRTIHLVFSFFVLNVDARQQ